MKEEHRIEPTAVTVGAEGSCALSGPVGCLCCFCVCFCFRFSCCCCLCCCGRKDPGGNANRPAVRDPPAANLPPAAVAPAQIPAWDCVICTMHNNVGVTECVACGSAYHMNVPLAAADLNNEVMINRMISFNNRALDSVGGAYFTLWLLGSAFNKSGINSFMTTASSELLRRRHS